MNVGSTAFSYDGRCNLTNDGTNAFTYTAENLLKTGPGGATLAYDPLGRLYQTVGGGTTTRFQYDGIDLRSEEHTSELQSLMRISYAVFCLKKQKHSQLTNQRYLQNNSHNTRDNNQ